MCLAKLLSRKRKSLLPSLALCACPCSIRRRTKFRTYDITHLIAYEITHITLINTLQTVPASRLSCSITNIALCRTRIISRHSDTTPLQEECDDNCGLRCPHWAQSYACLAETRNLTSIYTGHVCWLSNAYSLRRMVSKSTAGQSIQPLGEPPPAGLYEGR